MKLSDALKNKERYFQVNEREYGKINSEDFKESIRIIGDNLVKKNNPERDFVIDDNIKVCLEQLFYWMWGAKERFNGDIHKGVVITGAFGSGKTVLAKAFTEVYGMLIRKSFRFVSTYDVMINARDDSMYIKSMINKPILLDEIGREVDVIKNYGNEIRPVEELLTMRYNHYNNMTVCTSNYKLESLKDKYGNYIGDRLLDMFNFVVLPGKSRRK